RPTGPDDDARSWFSPDVEVVPRYAIAVPAAPALWVTRHPLRENPQPWIRVYREGGRMVPGVWSASRSQHQNRRLHMRLIHKIGLGISLAASLISGVALAQQQQFINVLTGGQAGVYYPLGVA